MQLVIQLELEFCYDLVNFVLGVMVGVGLHNTSFYPILRLFLYQGN